MMFKHILVPIDNTDLSLISARKAIEFAREIGAKVSFLTVIFPNVALSFGVAAIFDHGVANRAYSIAKGSSEFRLNNLKDIAAQSGVNSDSIIVEEDIVHKGIIETAENIGVDIIFMASHGKQAVSSILLGSETQNVLSHSKIPVLVYR